MPDLPRLRLSRLPEGGRWDKLGHMSLQILRFDNARCLLWQSLIDNSWACYVVKTKIFQAGMRQNCQSCRIRNLRCRLDVPTLPESWNAYPDLREVSLSDCGLSGSLPPSWGSLSRLQRLDLSENLLSGPLPPEWGQLSGLRSLDLSLRARVAGTGLRGELPSEWEALEKLRVLDLWNQGISGDACWHTAYLKRAWWQ